MLFGIVLCSSYDECFSSLYNHVRSCDALLGVPLDEPIQSIVSDGKRIFTAAGNNVHVWKRGKKVRERNYYAVYSMTIFIRFSK